MVYENHIKFLTFSHKKIIDILCYE